MIRVCEHCSNINIGYLKKVVGKENVQVECLENCAAYGDSAYGYIDDKLIVESTSDNWIKKISEVQL